MPKNGVKSMNKVRARKQCVQLNVMHLCSLETHTILMTIHFSLFTQPFLSLQVQAPSHPFLALWRYTVPLVPGTGQQGDIPQLGNFSLNSEVSLIHMCIYGKAKLFYCLNLLGSNMVNETTAPVPRQGASHSQFSSVVHQGPRHRGPLRPHNTEAGEGKDTTFNELLALLIATKIPDAIYQCSMCNIQGGEFE